MQIFFMSKGDNTIEEVSSYVDPPECQKNPICRWKEEWVSNSINKVSENGHKSSLSPGPDGMEEDTILQRQWSPKKELPELKLSYANLKNVLLMKSMVFEDISDGMRQLEVMEDIIDLLEYQMEDVKQYTFLLDEEAEEEIYTPGSLQLEEKMNKRPDLMNSEKVVFCLKDGEAEEEIGTPDSQQMREKIKNSLDLNNGGKLVLCLKAGGAEQEINAPGSQ